MTPFERVSQFVQECKDSGQQYIVIDSDRSDEPSDLSVADVSLVLRDAARGQPVAEAALPVPWSKTNEPAEKCRIYLSVIEPIRRIARAHGYAIGVHGSMMRDLDLIAVPWTEEAVAPHVLAGAIASGVCAVSADYQEHYAKLMGDVTRKPHGRLVFIIYLGHHVYIDLSVVPLVSAPPVAPSKE